jgi:hypothetical protein
MNRAIGALLLLVGIAPIAALFVWLDRNDVASISLDARGDLIAAAFALAEAACISLGLRLLLRSIGAERLKGRAVTAASDMAPAAA